MMQHISAVYKRVINVITNGIQTAPVTQTNGTASVQVQANAFSTANYPLIQHYGFASFPKSGSLHFKIAMAGDKSNAVSIGSNDNRYRPANGTEGDSFIYDDTGQYVRINSQGQFVEVNSVTGINLSIDGNLVAAVTASGIDVTGSVSTTGNLVAGTGATGSFTTPTGNIVTVQDGIITNIF